MAAEQEDPTPRRDRFNLLLEELRMRAVQIKISDRNWAEEQGNSRNFRVWFANLWSRWATSLHRAGKHIEQHFQSGTCPEYDRRRVDLHGSRPRHSCASYRHFSFKMPCIHQEVRSRFLLHHRQPIQVWNSRTRKTANSHQFTVQQLLPNRQNIIDVWNWTASIEEESNWATH